MGKKNGVTAPFGNDRLTKAAEFMVDSVQHQLAKAPTGMPPTALESLVLHAFKTTREQAEAKLATQRAPGAFADNMDDALACATPPRKGTHPGDPRSRATRPQPTQDHHGLWTTHPRAPPCAQAQLGGHAGHLRRPRPADPPALRQTAVGRSGRGPG